MISTLTWGDATAAGASVGSIERLLRMLRGECMSLGPPMLCGCVGSTWFPRQATKEAAAAGEAAPGKVLDENDPAFDSLKDVKLPEGLMDDDEGDEELGGSVPSGPLGAAAGGAAAMGGQMGGEVGDDEDDEEEDAEELRLRAGDMLFCLGRSDEDQSTLEVQCFNKEDGNLFVHHDISLPAMPLCCEWMDCAPIDCARTDVPATSCPVGSYVAVGTFLPSIEIWDLDVMDALEPVQILGGTVGAHLDLKGHAPGVDPSLVKAMRTAASLQPNGNGPRAAGPDGTLMPDSHEDAVMSLAWNRVHRNLLLSGSADHTVKLWDVMRGTAVHTFQHHKGKVQSVAWYPTTNPAQTSGVATAAFDRTVQVLDVRNAANKPMVMRVPSDPEKVVWHPQQPASLVCSLESGHVVAFDIRQAGKPLWSVRAHKGACSSVSFSPACKGLMATAGADKQVRLWDTEAAGGWGSEPRAVAAKAMGGGPLLAMDWCTHDPLTLACGGLEGRVAVWDVEGDAPEAVRPWAAGSARRLPPASVHQMLVRPRADEAAVAAAKAERTARKEAEAAAEAAAVAAAPAAAAAGGGGSRKKTRRGGKKKKKTDE